MAIFVLATMASVIVACGGGAESTGTPDSPFPIRPADELVDVGGPLYAQNCASCHGDASLPPPLPGAPPHTDEGHTWHHPDRLLVEWILDGVPLATVMPEWRGQLTEDQVIAIIAYMKTS